MHTFMKKIASLIMTLLLVSFLAFLTFQIIPGDPVTKMLGTEYTEEMAEKLRDEMGLNDPFFTRYFRWLGDFLTGDFGTSYSYRQPVGELLADKLPVTAMLSAMAFLLVVVLSIPLGIFLASHDDSIPDRILTALNQISMSIPPFFLGILMTLILGQTLHLFVPGGYVSFREDFGACLAYLLFPAIAIAIPKTAMTIKLLKSSIVSEFGRDYMRTALSRGNSRRRALYTHVLRNALIPVVTFLALAIPEIVAGSIIIEQVFTVPGLGKLLISSISNRDFPVVCAIVMLIAVLVILMNFLADLLYRVIDPRIRVDREVRK
ncbi:MAG: ABC transporter permease [Ruminococcaceae bacterium]|nr:ABC transporter permease [Oscillospiraceae bacterium]